MKITTKLIYDFVPSQPQTCIVTCSQGTNLKMKSNGKITFTSPMVMSKVHLLR